MTISSVDLNCTSTPQKPDSIFGDTVLCQSDSVKYTVNVISGATTYTWKLPNGWSGTSTSNLITTKVGSSGGIITVKANNNCGSSTEQSLNGKVNLSPPTPTISQKGNTLVSSSSTGNQWYLNGVLINGATSQNYSPLASGDYIVKITTNNCSSPQSSSFAYIITSIANVSGLEKFEVLPNPNSGLFNVNIKLTTRKDVSLKMYNMIGQSIYESQVYSLSGNQKKEINTANVANGIYLLETKIGEQSLITKIVIKR